MKTYVGYEQILIILDIPKTLNPRLSFKEQRYIYLCYEVNTLNDCRKFIYFSTLYLHHVYFQEHCLMGIKGTVRRSTDGDFIHANVDIDLIISEEPEYGSLEKPVEIFHIIEHFCLGRRR